MNHDHAHAQNYGDFDNLPFEVLLYIQADEVKNRKKQRKVETEVTTPTNNGKTTTKLNKQKISVKVADLRLKLATVQSKNIVLSNREIRLLRSIIIMIDDEANDGHDCYDNEDDMMMAVVAVDVGIPGEFDHIGLFFGGSFWHDHFSLDGGYFDYGDEMRTVILMMTLIP